MTTVRATRRSKIVIPLSQLTNFDKSDIVDGFSVDNFVDYMCAKCPLVKERLTKTCLTCENYKGTTNLARIVRDKKTRKPKAISFPLGAESEIERRLGVKLKLRDKVSMRGRMLKRPIKRIRDLYDGSPAPDGTSRIDQYAVVSTWMKTKMGVIHASARAGKTVLAVAISCELGMRTLVVTDRLELLNQFRETYIGGANRVQMTNAKPERVIIIEKMSDFDKPHDVALISYQKMIRGTGPALVAKYIKGKYGLLVNDECHASSADAYSKFLLRLDIPHRLGLSATPRRKDGRYRLTDTIIGPVVVRTKNVGLKPLIKVLSTGMFGDMKTNAWHVISTLLASTDERNKLIVRETYRMLDGGHQAIVIPVDRVEHVKELVERINLVALNRYRKNGRRGPEVIAIPFMGTTKNRPTVLAEFDSKDSDIRVLVCMRSIIKQGVDVSRPSGIICPVPTSGKNGVGAPLFSQLSYRASTPYHGKREPEVVLIVDDLPFIQRMTESLMRTEVVPNSDLVMGPKNNVYKIDVSCRRYLSAAAAKKLD